MTTMENEHDQGDVSPELAKKYGFKHRQDDYDISVSIQDEVHGSLYQPDGVSSHGNASLLVLDFQFPKQDSQKMPDKFHIGLSFPHIDRLFRISPKPWASITRSFQDLSIEEQRPPLFIIKGVYGPYEGVYGPYERPDQYHNICSWLIARPQSDIHVPKSFRVATLIERHGTSKFTCDIQIAYMRNGYAQLQGTSILFDPSKVSTSRLQRYDINKLASVNIDKLTSNEKEGPSSPISVSTAAGPSLSPIETSPATQQLKESWPISDLPELSLLNEWKDLDSYFRSSNFSPDGCIPHCWIINNSAAAIKIVVFKDRLHRVPETILDPNYRLKDERFFRPAAKRDLPSYQKNYEKSSTIVPLWFSKNDGKADMGHVGIFIVEDDKDRPSLIGWRSVSPGSRIEIYSERDVIHQKIHEFALKDLPLFPITINGNKFQPDKNIVGTSSHYILIQSYMPLTLEQEIKLNDLGESEDPKPSLQQYFSKNAYLYRWNSTNLDRIRLLDFVAYANVFPTECKMSRSLQSKLLQRHKPQQVHSSSKKLWGIDIVFHDDVKPKELESSIIEAAHLDSITFEYGLHKLRCKVQERYLGALCKIDDVRIIEEVPRWGLRDNSARTILGIGIHYMELGSMDGKGEIVAVADTGFDKGERDDVHRAFENRVEEICVWPPQNAQNARDARDTNGHGTHVCGLVLGNGLINGDRIQGAAPDARLLVECLGPSLKRKLNSLSELFQHSYDKGARVHNNSWGTIWQGVQYQYNHSAEEIDEFIWENKDMVICIAAGNDGEQQCDSQIGTEASSKNCITVGATMNHQRRSHKVALFSSRGPTVEHRIKPDVVAPGVTVLSTTSRSIHPAPKPYAGWHYLSGTSMATPLVSGCAAMLRQAYRVYHAESPSAALIKAMIINGAESVRCSSTDESGFGLVKCRSSMVLNSSFNNGGKGEHNFTRWNRHEPWIIPFEAHSFSNMTLKATLVWSDPKGAALQNLFSFVAKIGPEDNNQHERRGNINGPPTNPDDFDENNNVQQICWDRIPAGEGRMEVTVVRMGLERQEVACVWRFIYMPPIV